MGRPAGSANPNTVGRGGVDFAVFTLRMPVPQMEALHRLAKVRGTTAGALVRDLVVDHLRREGVG